MTHVGRESRELHSDSRVPAVREPDEMTHVGREKDREPREHDAPDSATQRRAVEHETCAYRTRAHRDCK
jgi:hypothetical protein